VVSASVVGPSEPSRPGAPPDGPQNGPNRPGASWDPKMLRFDTFVNWKPNRIWRPPEPANLASRQAPPGPPERDLPDLLENPPRTGLLVPNFTSGDVVQGFLSTKLVRIQARFLYVDHLHLTFLVSRGWFRISTLSVRLVSFSPRSLCHLP